MFFFPLYYLFKINFAFAFTSCSSILIWQLNVTMNWKCDYLSLVMNVMAEEMLLLKNNWLIILYIVKYYCTHITVSVLIKGKQCLICYIRVHKSCGHKWCILIKHNWKYDSNKHCKHFFKTTTSMVYISDELGTNNKNNNVTTVSFCIAGQLI